eukprot:TRINITY_DN2428_c0_g1_i10.p1 TRINITY_DN2428_c0_g1~~TRINITY_DN2428_c0_g1_i10.p1  ORF type:complete len:289 (+),score=96.68 TRINITY_DN2428_c0_g1_i10:45-911(+)
MSVTASLTDPHPWSALRWFTDIVYSEMLHDHPDADKEDLFNKSFIKCQEWWLKITDEQKKRFVGYEEKDKSLSKSSTSKKSKKTTPSKKSKAPRDPSKPKPPNTSFFQFCNSKRQQVKDANPEMSVTDISKKLSHDWHAMSEVEKQPYVDIYKREMAIFKENNPSELKTKRSSSTSKTGGGSSTAKSGGGSSTPAPKSKAPKDPNKPKQPIGAYMKFLNEKRRPCKEANPDMSGNDIMETLRKEWESMSDKKKKPYLDEYQSQMATYKKLLEVYNKEKKENGHKNNEA